MLSIKKASANLTKNVALFLSNIGLGDHIDMIGAIRYLAQFHGRIDVPCFGKNLATLSDFFSDEPKINLIKIDSEWYHAYHRELFSKHVHFQQEAINFDPKDYVAVYRSGYLKYPYHPMWPDWNIPKCFYKDLGLDLSIEHRYFKIPENNGSKEAYQLVRGMKYIFVQQVSSTGNMKLVNWDINEVFTIDPNMLLYPEGHKWYSLAREFVNRPFPHYTDTIIHASEIHVVNSAFRCLAAHLPLEATVKKCYHRDTGEHMPQWTFNYQNPTSPSE
jgi:hypothetical protein